MNEDLIPIEVLPYFSEIAKRLWSGHATIMVGAGFSKNAIRSSSTKKQFPNWNQLGDVFYKKAYGHLPDNDTYLNVLKLAEEVEATFGRPALDQILREEIPDRDYQPSRLHEELLKLPWTDVFTTNYDTLLERAADNITLQRFDIVTNKDDLIYSKKPRIIKLHGSFPSKRPFIITEEDYRQYPKKFAPFVNTVQQSLIENTLCLIGFSGDDPNFLNWIGWIHENLGKENSSKIYLIGILNLSVAQIKLLEKRNITPIDLSGCKDVNGNHEKAFNIFLEYLNNERKFRNSLGWPEGNQNFIFDREKETTPQLLPILENWRIQRLKYPNWIIVPEDRRETLKSYTEDSISVIYHLSKVNTPYDIEFLYEYNWRIERCLLPISNTTIKSYENVIEKYNPFPGVINIENSISPQNDTYKLVDWKEITPKWIELQLSLMRVYREEAFHSQWFLVANRLKTLLENIRPEFQARYYYERCLYYMFSLNITIVKKELEEWPSNGTLPFWEAKRAGLLAEIGDIVEAEKILETSLKFIRKELNLTPILNDYSYVSQEAYVMQLLNYVKRAVSLSKKDSARFNLDGDHFKDRWDILVQYKCDPWAELNLFKIFLDREPMPFKEKENKISFDIGQISTTYNLSGYDKYASQAYSFLRFMEEISIPYHLPWMSFGKESANGAIKHISKYSPYWAFATLIRVGDSKYSNSIFDRKTLSMMDIEKTDGLINEYLAVLESSKIEIRNSEAFQNSSFASSIACVLPEILSRLCLKSSFECKLKLILFLKDVFSSDFRDRYRGIGELTERLVSSFSDKDKYNLILTFLEFQILGESHRAIDEEYADPFNYLEIDKKVIDDVPKIIIGTERINDLFTYTKKTTKEKQIAIRRLILLWNLDLLSKKQVEHLAIELWRNTDIHTGFPNDSIYLLYSFLTLPHPKNINPEQLFRSYISQANIPIQANIKNQGIPLTHGNDPIFQEILGTSKSHLKYVWEVKDISILVKKLVEWWDADKKYLEKKDISNGFGSVYIEFKARFRNLILIFSDVISPNFHLLGDSEKKELVRIINEFENHNFQTLEAKVSLYPLIPNKIDKIYSDTSTNLYSKEKEVVIDALNCFKSLLRVTNEKNNALVSLISENIKSRNATALISCIKMMTYVIKKYPEFLNTKVQSDLKFGLTFLLTESQILPQDTLEEVDTKLSLKTTIAHLTVALHDNYESKNMKIPDYINKWKTASLNKNEFSEIRRVWEDA